MSNELVVDVQPKEVSIAILENKRLVELQKEARNISFSVGDIYLGKVKKLMPGLNAAFVDVGYEKDAFLHYLDLGAQFNSCAKFVKQSLSDRKRVLSISKFNTLPDIDKEGTISDVLKVGQEVLVQIAKEPISFQRPSPHCRNIFCRTFSRTNTICRQSIGISKNKIQRRKSSVKTVDPKYKT